MRWILIDQLLACEPGRSALACKTFSPADVLFSDHFPGLPTVPGVLQIEMVAQTVGRCIRQARPEVLTLLGVVKSARFVRRVEPDERCEIAIEVLKLGRDFASASGSVRVTGHVVSQVELLMALVPRPADVLPPDHARDGAPAARTA